MARAVEASSSVQKMQKRILRRDRETGETIGSELTVKTYTDRLRRFFQWTGLMPDEFLAKVESGEIEVADMLNDFLDERGKSPSTQKNYVAAIKKFLKVNLSKRARRSIDWDDIDLPRMRPVETDRAPTKEVLKRVLNFAGIQERALMLVALSSGMRIGTIASLTIGDVNLKTYEDICVIKVLSEKAKGKMGYVAFITPEAKEALLEYLEWRRRSGEELTPGSPLFAHNGKPYSRPDNLSLKWTKILKEAGLDEKVRTHHTYHFHTLRKFFRTRLEAAGVSASYRERLLGHKGGYLDLSYFDPRFEELLGEYRKAISYLTVFEEPGVDESRMAALEEELTQTQELLRSVIIGQVDRMKEKLRLGGVDVDTPLHELAVEMGYPPKGTQIMVDEEELADYLGRGWRFVASLNNGSGKCVVEKAR